MWRPLKCQQPRTLLPLYKQQQLKMLWFHCVSQMLPLIFLKLILLSYIPALSQPIKSDTYCFGTGNYTQNSQYQKNLGTLLSNLTTLSSSSKFKNTTHGDGMDKVYGLFYCRGDVDSSVCHNCVQSAAKRILQVCGQPKEAVIWLEKCTLRYSNRSFSKTEDSGWGVIDTVGNAANPAQFEQVLSTTMNGLIKKAAYDGAYSGFVTGEGSLSQGRTLYCLVQCVPYIHRLECERCLNIAYSRRDDYFRQIAAIQMFLPSCQLMYDTAPFYTSLSQPAPSGPQQSTPSLVFKLEARKNIEYYIARFGIAAVGVLMLLFALAFYLHKKRKKDQRRLFVGKDRYGAEALKIDLKTIKSATNNFSNSNKLGQGGFGAVYRGKLGNGEEVAVKRLSEDSGQGHKEFSNEVQLLAKLQHKNVVRLLGFCLKAQEKLLVYEFMHNSSLDRFLFDSNSSMHVDWQTRFKIITGIARGLLYLHEDSRLKILHRDLKASNILLDQKMDPKIGDFGLARLVKLDQTHTTTSRIAGTYGYMAPEYLRSGVFSTKSDVYSFGVLLLEIISGQRNSNNPSSEELNDTLQSRAWKLWNTNASTDFVDPSLGNEYSRSEAVTCIQVGLHCVQEDASTRPTMASVVLMINSNSSDLSSLKGPSPPFVSLHVQGSDGHMGQPPSGKMS